MKWDKRNKSVWLSEQGYIIAAFTMGSKKYFLPHLNQEQYDKGCNFGTCENVTKAKQVCEKMEETILRLETLHSDTGNCRVYVKDQHGNNFVLLDRGEAFEKALLPRYALMTHCKKGEPEYPVKEEVTWLLEKSSDRYFKVGINHIGEVNEQ